VPTRKQRRRRAKERRHEWEEVYLDEHGREVDREEADSIRTAERRDGRRPARAAGRSGRVIEPPSWRRVGKRALLFAPLMFFVIWLLEPDSSMTARAFYTFQLMLLFVPFSYLVDTVAYRMYRKRIGRVEGGAVPRP
jgi:hypothetical protein